MGIHTTVPGPRRWRALVVIACVAAGAGLPASARPVGEQGRHPEHRFTIEPLWLVMRDAIHLSATVFRPIPCVPGEVFPVLLEMLPYRKDDSFYLRDYPHYSFFARRGFIAVKVDVRGTGSSEGRVPPREYSAEEIEDAVEVIEAVARLGGANGRVGMWGISWGGFNALQVAMRRPPALGAILAAHASDDLYHDDVHYLDGILHLDLYQLEIDHEMGLPRSPDYPLDEAYFRDRFEAEPWLLTYLRHPLDGPFWREGSLRGQYERLAVPAFLIGGLADLYRDSVVRTLENARVPVEAQIGPWNHDFPDTGVPGPNHEWRDQAVRWWDRWLADAPGEVRVAVPRLAVFVRAGHPPDPALERAPGHWRLEEWPIRRSRPVRLYPAPGGRLGAARGRRARDSLRYAPGSGTAAGDWWGDTPADMAADDAGSLVYDTAPLASPIEVVGTPRVSLRASADARLAHWVARLEDVAPDGRVTLVTGGAINGAQRHDRLRPAALVPGAVETIAFALHFTTWTFRAGHRIRLAVTNAQFPMLWPTPDLMTTTLDVGDGRTWLELPQVPFEARPRLSMPRVRPRLSRPDAREVDVPGGSLRRRVVQGGPGGGVRYEVETRRRYEIGARRFVVDGTCVYATREDRPALSSFAGRMTTVVERPPSRLELATHMQVRSTRDELHVRLERAVSRDGVTLRRRVWRERIPRRLQ